VERILGSDTGFREAGCVHSDMRSLDRRYKWEQDCRTASLIVTEYLVVEGELTET